MLYTHTHPLAISADSKLLAPVIKYCEAICMNAIITGVCTNYLSLSISLSLFLSLLLQGLGRFEELEELDISENDLVFLPPSIGQLLYLRELNVSKNGEFHCSE